MTNTERNAIHHTAVAQAQREAASHDAVAKAAGELVSECRQLQRERNCATQLVREALEILNSSRGQLPNHSPLTGSILDVRDWCRSAERYLQEIRR